jgi:NAD(P)-dependent dehydrogenase (short-subunit alcohol dehydrogenase family)
MQLIDKICLVTGGTKGIGGATAIALAEQGASVAIVARHLDADANQTRLRIEALGRKCLMIAADMGKAEEATRCVEQMPVHVKQNNLDNRVPLHREGKPEQVATVIRELVTNDYVTGEMFTVDGGLTMRIC